MKCLLTGISRGRYGWKLTFLYKVQEKISFWISASAKRFIGYMQSQFVLCELGSIVNPYDWNLFNTISFAESLAHWISTKYVKWFTTCAKSIKSHPVLRKVGFIVDQRDWKVELADNIYRNCAMSNYRMVRQFRLSRAASTQDVLIFRF
jgi:hypothetical protein